MIGNRRRRDAADHANRVTLQHRRAEVPTMGLVVPAFFRGAPTQIAAALSLQVVGAAQTAAESCLTAARTRVGWFADSGKSSRSS
jgi:hypothetical protein